MELEFCENCGSLLTANDDGVCKKCYANRTFKFAIAVLIMGVMASGLAAFAFYCFSAVAQIKAMEPTEENASAFMAGIVIQLGAIIFFGEAVSLSIPTIACGISATRRRIRVPNESKTKNALTLGFAIAGLALTGVTIILFVLSIVLS